MTVSEKRKREMLEEIDLIKVTMKEEKEGYEKVIKEEYVKIIKRCESFAVQMQKADLTVYMKGYWKGQEMLCKDLLMNGGKK